MTDGTAIGVTEKAAIAPTGETGWTDGGVEVAVTPSLGEART